MELTLGLRFRKALRLARQAQYWPTDRLEAYQLAETRRMCRLAQERSPFYRQWFREARFEPTNIRVLSDLERLPTMARNTLREHWEAMCTLGKSRWQADYTSTGGTSGMPVRFYADAGRSSIEYAYLVASWERAGYRLGEKLAVFRGQTVGDGQRGSRQEYDPLLRRQYYSSFHMTDEVMRRYLEHLSSIGDCHLLVYPSSVTSLARFIQAHHVKVPPNIRGILAGSENVYDGQRKLVEEAFGRRMFSWYGHTEKLVLAAECEKTTDYHVWPTYGYCELLDHDARPVTEPGQEGEIVGTGFINAATPMIRYRTGDRAVYVGRRCEACGRPGLIVRGIRGHRTQEMLMTRSGSLISWTALNMHGDTFDHVRQFQFLQKAPGSATLRVVPDDGYSETDRKRILAHLGGKCGDQIEISLEEVEQLPLSPRGKAIYVDQQIVPWNWDDCLG